MSTASTSTEEVFSFNDRPDYFQQMEYEENRLELIPRPCEENLPQSPIKNDRFLKDKSWSSFAQIITTRSLVNSSGNDGLLHGPRKVLRLFVFGFAFPVLLLAIPLYVRLVLYPPFQQAMAPTDQRLFDDKTSGFWCRAQSFHMNGSFNAFLMPEKPTKSYILQKHNMLRRITLKDDYKEYWGFYLQAGSSITFRLCNRYDGGSLMILKGTENLHRCAWIGEEDSAEQDEDNSEESNEIAHNLEMEVSRRNDSFVPEMNTILLKRLKQYHSLLDVKKNGSEERRAEMDFHIERLFSLSKNKNEIVSSLNKKNKSQFQIEENEISDIRSKKLSPKHPKFNEKRKKSKLNKRRNKVNMTKLERVKRSLEEINRGALEEIDDEDISFSSIPQFNITDDLYTNIFHQPDGLIYERAIINQTSKFPDYSNEEHWSSYSSSEEALASCEGLLGAIPLYQDRGCLGFENTETSLLIKYPIGKTGTYYFIFSSDNEIFDSDIYLNMTIDRVVYNTSNHVDNCKKEKDCYLPLSFWSHEQTVIDVPEDDGWDQAYIIGSTCHPRVEIYLAILILIPIFILFCTGF